MQTEKKKLNVSTTSVTEGEVARVKLFNAPPVILLLTVHRRWL